jgi:DNA-binding HxlR family transcriptional regulator
VKNEHNVTIYLYGEGESREAVEKEFAWIGNLAGLAPDTCPDYALHANPDGTYSACNGMALVYYDANAALPPLPPAPSNSGGGEVFPQLANAIAFLKGAIGAFLGASPGEGQYGTAAEREAAIAGAKAATTFCPLLAAALVIILAFLLIYARPGLASGPVEPHIQKLLENETRQGIMRELSEADKVPTHLSEKLGVSKPAIVGRLAELVEAGLVEKVEVPGRKFVHYRLTQKGRQVLLRMAS